MSDLAYFQRALDLYGAAAYWNYLGTETANESAALATELRARAAAAGASEDQLVDAEWYARNCVSTRRKPLLAGNSFSYFRDEAVR